VIVSRYRLRRKGERGTCTAVLLYDGEADDLARVLDRVIRNADTADADDLELLADLQVKLEGM
jgi:hypothetical protein